MARVIDGDSFIGKIDLGFHAELKIPVRVRGINAPERDTPEGYDARRWAIAELLSKQLVVVSHKDQQSFARWICDVWTPEGNYAERIVEAGHAVVV